MIALTLKFVLAHFIGDFAFQPEKWVNHKLKQRTDRNVLIVTSLSFGVTILTGMTYNYLATSL